MKSLLGNKIFCIVMVTVLATTQVLLPLQASAVTVAGKTLNYDTPNTDNGRNPYKISFRNVVNGDLLTSLVGCTGIVNKVSKVSTAFIQNQLLTKAQRAAAKAQKKAIDTAARTILSTGKVEETINSIPKPGVGGGPVGNLGATSGDQALALADQLKKGVQDPIQLKAIDKIVEGQYASSFRDECLNGIATTLARNQLTAMTKATMNWISTGFNGDPMFVQNINSYTDSLTQQVIQKEINLFKGPGAARDYPYGQDFARGEISSYKSSKDSANALKQDLTNYLTPGATPESFATNFSQGGGNGGWDGWLALTQHPSNNPLGFTLKATENIGNKTAAETTAAKEEVARNGGYLDQKKCVEYEKQKIGEDYNYDGTPMDPVCIKYETVTPGSTIKDKVTTYVNSPERQLELAHTINDSLNSLFTALISKFQSQGLSSLGTKGSTDFSSVSGGLGSNSIATLLSTSLDNFGTDNTGNTGALGDSGQPIDITKDLGSIIQIQKDYIVAAKKYLTITLGVLPAVGELDYCIPGPNPNWKANADEITVYMAGVEQSRLATLKPSTYSNRWKSRKKNRVIRAEADGAATQAILDQLAKEETVLKARAKDYQAKANAIYGPKSPMQTPTLDNVNQNPAWLAMSQVGLNITKDLALDADNIAEDTDTYNQSMADVSGYIYQLNKIKKKVDAIVATAQARDDAERKKSGVPAIPKVCRLKPISTTTKGLDTNIDTLEAQQDTATKIRTGLNPDISDQMRADLEAFGYTDDQIDALSGPEAQALLNQIYANH